MKNAPTTYLLISILVSIAVALCGCRSAGKIADVQHADGNGFTRFSYVAVGGGTRPGAMIVISQIFGTNTTPPTVVATAHGPPATSALLGLVGDVGSAATLGALWPNQHENNSSTTVIQGDPPAPPIVPPTPARPSRPPWGPPNGWEGRHPHNRGH